MPRPVGLWQGPAGTTGGYVGGMGGGGKKTLKLFVLERRVLVCEPEPASRSCGEAEDREWDRLRESLAW